MLLHYICPQCNWICLLYNCIYTLNCLFSVSVPCLMHHVTTSTDCASLITRPLPAWEKSLLHNDCTCACLYPESECIAYFHKIFSKLFKITSSCLVCTCMANKRMTRDQRVSSIGWQASKNKETYPGICLSKRSDRHMVSYSMQTILWKSDILAHAWLVSTRPFSCVGRSLGTRLRLCFCFNFPSYSLIYGHLD